MRLTHFEVRGHRVLQDMTVDVRDHLVIIGANDVGKTWILRLLHALLGASVQQLFQTFTLTDIREGEDELSVVARLEDLDADELALFPFETSVEAGEPNYLVLQLEVRPSEEDPDNVAITRFFPDSGTRRGPSRNQLLAIGWRYLPATRSSGPEFMDGRTSPFRTMLDSADLGDEIEDFGALLQEFNNKLEENTALLELRKTIATHLSRSVPKTYTEDALAIRTSADPVDQPLQDVTIYLREGDRFKSLSEQSDGMRQLMALTFFDLAQVRSNIVAVDEPEIHLHASSQRTVAALFAESPKQRIVVTHSPYIVHRFEPKHVLVINPASEARQLAEENFSDVEKEMLHWWSPYLLESLTARRVLLVEGLADRILIEAAARALGIGLDRIGVSVLALDGADKFSHVLKILGRNGFRLPVCGLCDEDREQSWAGTLGLRPRALEQNGFFVARKDLEHEYVRAAGVKKVVDALIAAKVARTEGITQSTGAADIDSVTPDQLGTFLSSVDSRKVPAARAVAPILTPEIVAASPSLMGLISFLKADA
ncbi:hypothetical protein MCHLDSM_04239 [Mycolicibacterium chlorophenolicum]|uniref:Uncharacterized protein n=2 Tax=Mycobacteriaceae TaxID=1762 RepID=A0A0J6VQV6_9MYCO|nr:hypothetical protein MCHLDSM_04239 [Mycolicibacterium chlorophenolicum]